MAVEHRSGAEGDRRQAVEVVEELPPAEEAAELQPHKTMAIQAGEQACREAQERP